MKVYAWLGVIKRIHKCLCKSFAKRLTIILINIRLIIMIHCICNNINTAKVDLATSNGACCAADVLKSCNMKFNCGQCRISIDNRVAELRLTKFNLEAAE